MFLLPYEILSLEKFGLLVSFHTFLLKFSSLLVEGQMKLFFNLHKEGTNKLSMLSFCNKVHVQQKRYCYGENVVI